jgi:hypothetical protein
MTAALVASAVTDQGTVYSAQFPPEGLDCGLRAINTSISSVVNTTAFALPLDEDSLTLLSPKYYTGPAREGVFLPSRLTGPTQPYVAARPARQGSQSIAVQLPLPTKAGSAATIAPIGSYGPTVSSYVNQGGHALHTHPVFLVGSPAVPTQLSWVGEFTTGTEITSNQWAVDSNYDNTNIGVTIFRGLAGSGGGAGFSASVMVKVCVGLEVIPTPDSPDRIFTTPATSYDPRAMEAYFAIALELDPAFPARYNSFATILALASTVASRLLPLGRAALTTLSPMVLDYIKDRIRASADRTVHKVEEHEDRVRKHDSALVRYDPTKSSKRTKPKPTTPAAPKQRKR